MDTDLRLLERQALSGDEDALKRYEQGLKKIGKQLLVSRRALLACYVHDQEKDIFEISDVAWSHWSDTAHSITLGYGKYDYKHLGSDNLESSPERFLVDKKDGDLYQRDLNFIHGTRYWTNLYRVMDIQYQFHVFNAPPQELPNTEEMWDLSEWEKYLENKNDGN